MPGQTASDVVPAALTTTFAGLQIGFDSRVLRPRPWTEAHAQWASVLLDELPPGPVLELCAGAGHIGLAATARSSRQLVLVDADPAACGWARRNADRAGVASRTEVREAGLDRAVASGETFSLIVADPPWVPSADIGRFPEDPSAAIDGGIDGLDVARTCVGLVSRHLAPGGAALLQLGSSTQVESIAAHLAETGSSVRCRATRRFDRGVVVLIAEEGWLC